MASAKELKCQFMNNLAVVKGCISFLSRVVLRRHYLKGILDFRKGQMTY